MFYALVAVPLGRLADSVNRRRLITIGIVAWTIAAIACGLAETYTQLFLARMAVGVGEAVLTPAGFSLLADLFRARRLALPISVFTASSFFGSGIALIFGGYMISYLSGLSTVGLPIVAMWKSGRQPSFSRRCRDCRWHSGFICRCVSRRGRQRPWPALMPMSIARVSSRHCGFACRIDACLSQCSWVYRFSQRRSSRSARGYRRSSCEPHAWTTSEIGSAQGFLFIGCGVAGVVCRRLDDGLAVPARLRGTPICVRRVSVRSLRYRLSSPR